MFNQNSNSIEVTELFRMIYKLEREKKILLDTIDNQNRQLEEFEELKDEFKSSELEKENFQHAMFVVLYNLKHQENKEIDKKDLVKTLNEIGSLAINSLLNKPIIEHFEEKVLKGGIIAQQLSEEYHDALKFK